MKRKYTLLFAFLLLLFIAPAISAYDNVSPDSIISFSETLPDDYMFYPDNETHGTGYAESFADVSDWTEDVDFDVGSSISSDGDYLTFLDDYEGGAWDSIYTNVPSLSSFSGYIELRHSGNGTNMPSYGNRIYLWTLDNEAGSFTYHEFDIVLDSVFVTEKFYVSEQDIECVEIRTRVNGPAKEIYYDYLRISPANESGWQHDCSTVVSTTVLRVDVESDGDHIQFQYSGGGGTGELSFHTDFGGSAIAAIDTDYYSFIGWNVVNLTDDFYEVYADNTLVYTGTGLGLQHVNVKASGEGEYTTITFVLNTVTETMALDWVKGFSIADFIVTQSASCSSSDIVYVDSNNNLVFDRATIHWMVLETPYTNITTASYPVWNITKSGNLGFGIRTRGGPSYAWGTAVYGTTRGATAELISVFDPFIIMIQIHSQSVVGVCTISEIKFIEEITMEINIFDELFMSTEMWGYFGPLALVIIGYLLTKKNKELGIFLIIVESLIIYHYLTLLGDTPEYWWHVIILLLGVILCAFQMMDR